MNELSFRKEINDIILDKTHGSSVLTEKIIDTFLKYHPADELIQWALNELNEIDPSMHAVHHLLNHIKKAKHSELFRTLEAYQEKWSKVDQHIAVDLSKQLPGKEMCILVHSHSGMVMGVLKHLKSQGFRLKIIQTKSPPGKEGIVQAKELSHFGFEVRVVADSQLPDFIHTIDTCLLGTDQYDNHYFVNKIGSGTIVKLCAREKVSVYILGDIRKKVKKAHSNSRIFERIRFDANTCLLSGSIN